MTKPLVKKTNASLVRGNPPECLLDISGFMIYKLAQSIQEKSDLLFEREGLKARHFCVLHVLTKQSAMTQQALCEGLWIDRGTMVGVVQTLLKKKLVSKKNHPDDKRSFFITATEAGHQLQQKYIKSFSKIDETLFPSLSGSERRQLKIILEKSMGDIQSQNL